MQQPHSRVIVVMLLLAFACKDKPKHKGDPKGKSANETTEADAAPPRKEMPKRQPMADSVEQIRACWKAASEGDDQGVVSCYTDDAEVQVMDWVPERKAKGGPGALEILADIKKLDPTVTFEVQGLIINDPALVTVVYAKGDKVSMFMAQIGQLDKDGRLNRDLRYFDQATLLHQLGTRKSKGAPGSEKPWAEKLEVVADQNDKSLAGNLETYKTILAALGSKDAKQAASMYTDDAVLRYMPEATPRKGKTQIEKGYAAYFALTSSMSSTALRAWVAGDWIVAETLIRAKTSKGNVPFTLRQVELLKLADGSKLQQHYVFGNRLKFDADVGLYKP